MGQTQNGHLLAFSHSAALPQHVRFLASRAYIARSLASSVPSPFPLSRVTVPEHSSSSLTASCFAASSNRPTGLMPWSVATRDEPSRIKSGWLCDSCMRLLTVMYKLQVLHYRKRIYREGERVAKSLSDLSAEYSRLIAGRYESHDYVNVWSRSRDSSMELPLSCSLLDFTLEIRLGSHGVCVQKFLRKLCQCLSMSSR
ncbi:unnamed protein product [Sphagnum troendelagicum]|uniref:Uncharacterized protein n=1 Tax=Sphagnum troendelagicum TaxID=128251 RepID=A0ABP0UC72_9BRYO